MNKNTLREIVPGVWSDRNGRVVIVKLKRLSGYQPFCPPTNHVNIWKVFDYEKDGRRTGWADYGFNEFSSEEKALASAASFLLTPNHDRSERKGKSLKAKAKDIRGKKSKSRAKKVAKTVSKVR